MKTLKQQDSGYFRFSKNVAEALREVFFAQIVEATMNMCLLEYYCIMVKKLNPHLFVLIN